MNRGDVMMKPVFLRLRRQRYSLLAVFLIELPFGFLMMLYSLIQLCSDTSWWYFVHRAIVATQMSHLLLEESALMIIFPVGLPSTLLLVLGVLGCNMRRVDRTSETGVDCFWAFLSGMLYALVTLFFAFNETSLLGGLCLLASLLFHALLIRTLWQYHKAICQEKQRLKNSEIPTETAGK